MFLEGGYSASHILFFLAVELRPGLATTPQRNWAGSLTRTLTVWLVTLSWWVRFHLMQTFSHGPSNDSLSGFKRHYSSLDRSVMLRPKIAHVCRLPLVPQMEVLGGSPSRSLQGTLDFELAATAIIKQRDRKQSDHSTTRNLQSSLCYFHCRTMTGIEDT